MRTLSILSLLLLLLASNVLLYAADAKPNIVVFLSDDHTWRDSSVYGSPDNPTTRRWRAKYMAAICTMDTELGQVYDLARKKLGEETLFLHTSDHGAQWPFGKWNLYDDGIRTVLRYQQRPAEELYFVTDDPFEQRNLIGDPAHADRVAKLRKTLDRWMDETNDSKAIFGPPKRISEANKPNIITVFIDDLGWSDLSCFGGQVGESLRDSLPVSERPGYVETENIDRLAAEGIRFTNFYVNSPICSPSRVALTTGQYPQRWRITSCLAKRAQNKQRGMAQWLDPNAPILARELNHAGYATGHFGKWHMGGQRNVRQAPLITAYGFDRSLTNFEGLGARVLPLCDSYNGRPPKKHDLGSASLGRGPIRWEDRSVITAGFVKDAIEFIDHAQVTGQPFFLNLWPDDVHSPFFPPKESRDATDKSKQTLYYAVLDAMDQQLGLLFDRIRNDVTLQNNTLIMVTSDNGPEPSAGSSTPLRGAKTMLFEGGVRSPLIVWGPGLLARSATGLVNETSVLCSLDLNRSLYALTDTPLPEGMKLDGENLADTLIGKEKQSRTAPIFWRRPPDRPGSKEEPNPDLAVRDGRWKFYLSYDGTSAQLYNLEADLSETDNSASRHPQVIARLKEAVLEWNADLPKDAGDPSFRRTNRPATSKRQRSGGMPTEATK